MIQNPFLRITEHQADHHDMVSLVERLYFHCFDDTAWSPASRMRQTPQVSILIAWLDNEPAGFKVGYPESRTSYYRWLGGVLPTYRRQGIARSLMDHRHHWCEAAGYTVVRTQTFSRNRGMLILNLLAGFEIYEAEEKDLELILKLHKDLPATRYQSSNCE